MSRQKMMLIDGVSLQSSSSSTQENVDIVATMTMEHPTIVSASNAFKSIPDMNAREISSDVKCVYVFQREYATVDPALVQENVDIVGMLEHPAIVSSSNAFKSIPEMNAREISPDVKCVYVFQREYATVDPALVQLVGTDEATTCVGLVIRNRKSGMTSVSHMDSPKIVDTGLNQMLASVIDHDSHADEVHLIGGYEDISQESSNGTSGSESNGMNGYSYPLCSKILDTLRKRQENFHLETCSGTVSPANFDRDSRCPDEIVRRVRVTVSSKDPTWKGKLLETYDTKNDQFQIVACSWTPRWKYIASSLQQFSDLEILQQCSTSPLAEGPDFVDNERRFFSYFIKQPNWRETFPMRKSRVFERSADGGWTRC